MLAIVLNGYGSTDVLDYRQVPDPHPGPEELLVDVVATALNRADILQREGRYPGPPSAFEVPGLEFSGRVREVGERVTSWSEGDQVMGIVSGGAYAEMLTIHERQAMRVPSSIALVDAAAIPEAFLSAFDALVVQGELAPGDWALIHAGASGVGSAAIQLGKAHGAKVLATASASKLDRCTELGADAVIDYREGDVTAFCAEATGGAGVDVVLDFVGGENLGMNLGVLAPRGRLIQVGTLGSSASSIQLDVLMSRRLHLIGTVLRSRPLEEKASLVQRFTRQVLHRFDEGTLFPVIDSKYSFRAMAEAHRRMEANENVGKIVIEVHGH